MAALLEYQNDSGYLGIEIDAAEREGYGASAETAEHAVEYGAAVVDHLRRNADTITLECIVTNAPVVLPSTHMGGATMRVQPTDIVVGGKTLRASLFAPSGPFDRVRAVDEALSALVGTALVRYTGSLRATVDDLAITRYEVTREAATGDALAFTLELKKIRRASVRRVRVPAQRRGQPPQQRGAESPQPRASFLVNALRSAGVVQ